jgi:hypothetical protein
MNVSETIEEHFHNKLRAEGGQLRWNSALSPHAFQSVMLKSVCNCVFHVCRSISISELFLNYEWLVTNKQ